MQTKKEMINLEHILELKSVRKNKMAEKGKENC